MTLTEWPASRPDVMAGRTAVEAAVAGTTLLTEYAATVAAEGGTEAHRWQDAAGEWHSLTYRQVRARVADAALGLRGAGLRPGEFAAIWSRNRSEATIADYAVMHARAVPVFLYPTLAPEQAAYIAGHCAATIAIAENREFLARLLSVRGRLPELRRIILIDGADEGALPDETVLPWSHVLERGRAEAARSPGLFDEMWHHVTPEDLATLIYTSGTTGPPKGVMLTHRNVRCYQAATSQVIPAEQRGDADGVRLVSYLPMAHVTGRSMDHWGPMYHPTTLVYCPDHLRLFEIAAQARPTTLMGIPRVWEKLHAALCAALVPAVLPQPSSAAVRALPEPVRHGILAKAGLDACRLATTGSAPLDPEIIEFFRALGLPLSEGWGMTELSNAATLVHPDRARVGAVGRPLPGTEARIAQDGEILIRGPGVMRGYYRDPERTAETIDADGWLHTGDIGSLDDDGYLRITDRKKELIITSGGKNISPALVEYQLQRHPLIGQACAIGDRRNYVTALLVLDPDAARAWAAERGIEATDLAGLSAHPDVLAEVERAVAEANSHLARVEQVRRYRVLPAEWTAETGELTPSLKRRRRVIAERYAEEIGQLYQ